jgi:DNA-binding NtrC family response regulator
MEKKNVLFVDDDVIVLQSLERGLMDDSYNRLYAKNSQEALEILKHRQIHVIVTDMCMPDMTGIELLRVARQNRPEIIGIVLSGYEKDPELLAAVEQGEIFRLIKKPWKLGEANFEKIVRKAVDQADLLEEKAQSANGALSRLKNWIKSGSNK